MAFLQKPPEEQDNLLDRNFAYYNSLRDWNKSYREDPSDYPELEPYQKRLEDIVSSFPTQVLLQLSQLLQQKQQLQEENNRLSKQGSPPRKCNHGPQIEELETSLKLKENECKGLQHDLRQMQKTLHQFQNILPEGTTPRKLEELLHRLQSTERNSNHRAIALESALEDWEQVGKILDPEHQNAFNAATRATALITALAATQENNQTLQQEIADLRDTILSTELQAQRSRNDTLAVLRTPTRPLRPEEKERIQSLKMTQPGEGSSSGTTRDQTATSGMWPGGELTAEQCRSLWNQIPPVLRAHRATTPTNSVEMMEALAQTGCTHPHQLHLSLGNMSQNDWDENILLVEQLVEQARAPNQNPIIVQPTSRLFKVSEIPEFSNTKEYERYRSQLQRFLRAHGDPQPQEYGQALERILQAFTADSAKVAAESWLVTDLLRPTWAETTAALISALDNKFEDNNLLEEAQLKWYQTRLKDGTDINEFFNHYDAAAARYLLAQKRKGIPETAQISPAVVTTRLLQILPPYLRNALKLRLATTNQIAETLTLNQLRPHLEDLWRYLPKPAGVGHNTNNRFQTASSRINPAQPSNGPNKETERQCGLICSYDTSPPVPNHFRGPLFPDTKDPQKTQENHRRRIDCANAQVCLYCRRPRSEHKASGPRFKPVLPPPTTRHTPANHATPLPESRQIEAPLQPSTD